VASDGEQGFIGVPGDEIAMTLLPRPVGVLAGALDRLDDRDRRPTMAAAITEVLARGGPPLTIPTLLSLLERVLRQRVPVTSLTLTRPTRSERGTVLGCQAVTLPVPQAPGPAPLALTARLGDHLPLDRETLGWFEMAACLVGVWLRAPGDALVGPPLTPGGPAIVGTTDDGLIGSSGVMAALRQRVCRFAQADAAVLILGESGTGKELVARALHRHSRRSGGPFLAVSCASLVTSLLEPEFFGIEAGTATDVKARQGKFELARGGTLFLDEIGDLSRKGQASLLRVLQERSLEPVGGHRTVSVDVRIVAATNRALVGTSRFRPELYFRLCVLPVHVPPLRARGRDVLELAQAFLDDDSRGWRWGIEPDAADALLDCDWPGNVRQLQSLVHLIQAEADRPVVDLALVQSAFGAMSFTPRARSAAAPMMTLKRSRALHALKVLQACGGNKTRAAGALGISTPTLRAHLRDLDAAEPAPTRRRAA
jgi:transcriptional regulator with AAA-type ATPase domain